MATKNKIILEKFFFPKYWKTIEAENIIEATKQLKKLLKNNK